MAERITPIRKQSVERAIVNPPGAILAMELEARGWSQKDLSTIIQRPEQAISEIVHGKKRITAETAQALASAFGSLPDFWLRLEANYQVYLSRENVKRQEIARRSELFSMAPITEMVKRGWLKLVDGSTKAFEDAIEIFYGSKTPESSPYLAKMCLRSPESRVPEEMSKVAWAVQVFHLSKELKLQKYHPERLDLLIKELRNLMVQPRDVAKVPETLANFGVGFVCLEHLPHTYIDGACIWIDDNPIIAMTFRYDRMDYFWFTLMHELAHIKLNHVTAHIDSIYNEGRQKLEEVEADTEAENWVIDNDNLQNFLIKNTKPTKEAIDLFAQSESIHPSLVIGRLQYEGVLGYGAMRSYIPKVKRFLGEMAND